LELSWPTHRQIVYGQHLGYGAANQKLREAILKSGINIRRQGKIAVHLCRPDAFKPIKKKKNVLFTMYEGYPVPENFRKAFKRADLLLTPSNFCKEMFDPLCGEEKFKVIPLGFDSAQYAYSERRWSPGEPFIWLWVGAPNARKGWDTVLKCWDEYFSELPWMHLFMKTTSSEGNGGVETLGNITFDSRRYTDQGLAELYSKCNAFVLPTAGEGWGLTLLEALASGLPIVTTRHGGQMDFLNEEFARFVKFDMKKVTTREGSEFEAAIACYRDLASEMFSVVEDYSAAASMAEYGSRMAHMNFTWGKSADKLAKVLKDRFA